MTNVRLLGLGTAFAAIVGVVIWSAVEVPSVAPSLSTTTKVRAPEADHTDSDSVLLSGTAADDEPVLARESASAVVAAELGAAPRVVFGQVVDAAGRAIPGASVQSVRTHLAPSSSSAAEVTTDAEGRFRLSLVGPAGRLLRVAARGFCALHRVVPMHGEGDLDLGIQVLQSGAVVAGLALDSRGIGVARTRVWQVVQSGREARSDARPGDDREAAVTDAEGRFELSHCVPGAFDLVAEHGDHPTARLRGLAVLAGSELANVVLTLEPGCTLSGRVVDLPPEPLVLSLRADLQGTADPPAGSAAGQLTAEVDADGRFELRGLHVGRSYRVWASQTGHGVAGASAICTQVVHLATPHPPVELHFAAGVSVTCQVVSADDGAPIEALWVGERLREAAGPRAARPPRALQCRSYPQGRITLQHLRPSDTQVLDLVVAALGHATMTRLSIPLPRHGELDLGVMHLDRAPTLQVLVRSKKSGAPVPAARVRVQEVATGKPAGAAGRVPPPSPVEGPRVGATDEQGRCTISLPLDEPMQLLVDAPGHAPFLTGPLSLAQLGSHREVELLGGGTVAARLLDAAGAPVKDGRIGHASPDGGSTSQMTGADGEALFIHLAPGMHSFGVARRPGPFMAGRTGPRAAQEAGWQAVAIQDGEHAVIELRAEPAASLQGFVREAGLPVASARVSLLDGVGEAGSAIEVLGTGIAAITDTEGRFQLDGLPPGLHRLCVTAKDRAWPTTVPVRLLVGSNAFDVELDTTWIHGTVRGPDGGGGLADATVALEPVGAASVRVQRGSRVTAGAAGVFELRSAPAGVALRVRAWAAGHATSVSAPFELAAGSVRLGVDVQLVTGGNVRITSAVRTGGLQVYARPLSAAGGVREGVQAVGQTLRRGEGTLTDLEPGDWRLEILSMEGDSTPAPRIVRVVGGETVSVAF